MNTFGRVGAWFTSLLLSVTIFCLLWPIASFLFVFRITMTFAFPVSLLYLPAVIGIKNAREGRLRTLLVSGILIGPVSLCAWGLILQLRGAAAHSVWWGDGLAPGLAGGLVFALIVGSLTTTFYVATLRFIPRRNAG